MADREPEIRAIFCQALELPTSAAQTEYLQQACQGQPELRERIEGLLEAHRRAGSFLAEDERLDRTVDFPPVAELPGTQIGRYKLLQELGEGGFGVIYLAEQQEPVRRQVALKIIKPGMDTREVITRFEAERQALALMDHPNIAHVHDAGATDSGRPYFVMELVHGVPISDFCDQYEMTVRARLELFVTVCQAVQHAHHKGIIHRDIKPSNVLVALNDDMPVPKVIDFGVAKATGGRLTDGKTVTSLGQLVGTPMYMSPEQAERSSLDIDTRSDIYSLGVLLYELLTGSTPLDRDQFKDVGLDEVRRMIREQEPPRPSTRISTMGKAATTVSEHRQTNPVELSNSLRHELDWIVMKALEKDRTRRYQTANDFARDVQRYLDDEPVEACPPSRLYRLSKFARRNKAALISAIAVLLSLMTALVAVALISVSRRELADRRRELTDQRLQVQQGINDALAEVAGLRRRASTAEGSDEADLTAAREKLQRAIGLAESGPMDPELAARVRALEQELDKEVAELAQVRRDRDLLAALEEAWRLQANVDVGESRFTSKDSVPFLRKALKEYGIMILDSPPRDVAAMINSRPKEVREHVLDALEELRALARPIIGIALQTANATTVITGIAPDSPAARDGRLREGDELVGVGEGREGEMVSTRSLARPAVTGLLSGESGTTVRLEVIPKDEMDSRIYEIQRDPAAAWLKAVVVIADRDPWRVRLREALQLIDREKRLSALEELAEQVDVQKQPVRVLTRLAGQLTALGSTDRAILDLLRKVQQTFPGDLWANANLATALQKARPPQLEEAIRYYTAAIALRPDSAGLHFNLGISLDALGKREEANQEYRESLRIIPVYAPPRCNLVDNLVELGKDDEAEAIAREAVQRWPQASTYANLGRALNILGKNGEAAVAYREALRLDPGLVDAHINAARELFGTGRTDEALAKFREVIQMAPTSVGGHYNLGVALGLLGRLDEASEAYRACLKLDLSDSTCVGALTNLILILKEQGRAEEAVAVCREVLERAPDSPNVQSTWNTLAGCLMECGRREEAIAAFRESIRLFPEEFMPYANLARTLANPLDPTLRQPQEAVELAMKAVDLEPQEELAWYALGIARFRNQEWQPAIEAFQKSESYVDVRKYGTLYSHDPAAGVKKSLYRAMAYWQLGQTDEARAWFLVGEDQMKYAGPERDLSCLQEAAKLLGMSLDEPRNAQTIIAAYRATLKTQPDGADRHCGLAWLLADTPDLQYREPEPAVQHALQAVQLMPQKPELWFTLGVTHYRNGQWNAAVEALQKSMDLSGGGSAYDWLFLAMIHWQLDQKDEAQKWYDKAVIWMKDRAEDGLDEHITRFRAEADQLLGIEKAKSEQPNVSEPPVSTDKAASPDEPVDNVPAIPPQDP